MQETNELLHLDRDNRLQKNTPKNKEEPTEKEKKVGEKNVY